MEDYTTIQVYTRTKEKFDLFYEQFCAKMGMKCTKLEFIDIVVEHFDLLQEAQRKAEAIEKEVK